VARTTHVLSERSTQASRLGQTLGQIPILKAKVKGLVAALQRWEKKLTGADSETNQIINRLSVIYDEAIARHNASLPRGTVLPEGLAEDVRKKLGHAFSPNDLPTDEHARIAETWHADKNAPIVTKQIAEMLQQHYELLHEVENAKGLLEQARQKAGPMGTDEAMLESLRKAVQRQADELQAVKVAHETPLPGRRVERREIPERKHSKRADAAQVRANMKRKERVDEAAARFRVKPWGEPAVKLEGTGDPARIWGVKTAEEMGEASPLAGATAAYDEAQARRTHLLEQPALPPAGHNPGATKGPNPFRMSDKARRDQIAERRLFNDAERAQVADRIERLKAGEAGRLHIPDVEDTGGEHVPPHVGGMRSAQEDAARRLAMPTQSVAPGALGGPMAGRYERNQQALRESTRAQNRAAKLRKKNGLARMGDQAPATPVSYEQAHSSIERAQAEIGDSVEIHHAQDGNDVPADWAKEMQEEGQDPHSLKGWLSADGKRLWINNAMHGSAQDVEATLAHEIIGHRKAIPVIDEAWQGRGGFHGFAQALDRNMGGVDQLMRDLGIYDKYKGEDLDTKAKEVVAAMEERRAGEGLTDRLVRTWKEIVGAVRQWLQDKGLRNFATAKDYDIYNLLRQARNADHLREVNLGEKGLASRAYEGPQRHDKAHTAFYGTPATTLERVRGAMHDMFGHTFQSKYFNRDTSPDSMSKLLRERGGEGDRNLADQSYADRILFRRSSMMGASSMSEGAPVITNRKVGNHMERVVLATGAKGDDIQAALKEGNRDPEAFDLYVRAEQMLGLGHRRVFEDAYNALSHAEWLKIAEEGRKDAYFQKARKALGEYNKANLHFMVQAGAISPEEISTLEGGPNQRYFPETYAPLFREEDGEVKAYYGALDRSFRVGNLKETPDLKRLLGGNKSPVNLMTGILMNTMLINRLATGNMAARSTAHMMEAIGGGKFVTPGTKGADVFHFNDWDKETGAKIERAFQVASHLNPRDGGTHINAAQFVQAMEGLPISIPSWVRAAATPAQWMRHLTLASPFYTARQLMKEPLAMWLGAGADTSLLWRTWGDFAKTVKHLQFGEAENKSRKRAMQMYLVSGGTLMGDAAVTARELMKHDPSTWKRALGRMEEFGIAADSAMRDVYLDDLIKKGFSERDAFIATAKNTVDFFQKGLDPNLAALRQMVPFFSSQLAALDTLRKGITGQLPFEDRMQIQKKMFQRGAIVAMGTLAYSLLSKDQPYYQQASDDDRYGNWFIPFQLHGEKDPAVLRVPIPYEYAYLFKILPEIMANRMAGDANNAEMFDAFKNMLVNATPGVMPQAIKPVIEAMTNYNFFTGHPLLSEQEKKLTLAEQHTPTTTWLARQFGGDLANINGEKYGISPILLEHFVKSYAGPLGLFTMQLTGLGAGMFGAESEAQRPSKNLSQLPLAGSMFQGENGSRYIDRIEGTLSKVQAYKGAYDKMLAEHRYDDVKAFLDDPDKRMALALAPMAQQWETQDKKLRDMEGQIRFAKGLSPDQKQDQLNKLQEMRSRQAQSFGNPFSTLYPQ
jgi:hypothetical protein